VLEGLAQELEHQTLVAVLGALQPPHDAPELASVEPETMIPALIDLDQLIRLHGQVQLLHLLWASWAAALTEGQLAPLIPPEILHVEDPSRLLTE
jgi:hypothetical protein